MAEYIEREAAKLRIFEYGVRHRDNSSISFACENLERQMNSIPAADVRPVVRGKWEHTEDFDEYGGGRYVEWTCSECFFKVKGDWAVRDSHIDEKPRENFCPNCGADMREES